MTTTKRVRMWRWRSNPLRRRSDRVEAWVVLCAMLAVVLGGGVAAAFTWTASLDLAEEQRAERERVPALVTGKAEGQVADDAVFRSADGSSTRAPVRWTAPDGAERTGVAEVPRNTGVGDTVHLWVDADGRQTVAPVGTGMSFVQAGLSVALAFGTLAAVICLLQAAVRARIDRQRAKAWERAWAEVEPRWRHRAS